MSRPLAAIAAACLACLLGGCGAERAARLPTTVQPGEPTQKADFPRAGVALRAPRIANVERRPAPGVFRVSVGDAFVAGFAYRRGEQLPRSGGELEVARRRLVREAGRRAGSFRPIRSRTRRFRGAPAIELVGDQTISRARLRTRSLHVFKGDGEYVVEELAPVRSFSQADRAFFAPVARSLRLSGRIEPQRKKGR